MYVCNQPKNIFMPIYYNMLKKIETVIDIRQREFIVTSQDEPNCYIINYNYISSQAMYFLYQSLQTFK